MPCHVEKDYNTTMDKLHLYEAYNNIRHIQISIPEEFKLIAHDMQIFTHLKIYIKVTNKLNVLTNSNI
jgi:uncharacterized protein YktA (UPF0223 family)